jgi:translation initiation factor IF-1
MKYDAPETTGTIAEACRDSFFRVKVADSDHVVLARVSGRLWKNHITLVAGDAVKLELTPYDPTPGRITYRLTPGTKPTGRARPRP